MKSEAQKKELFRAMYIILFVCLISTIYTIPFWFKFKYQKNTSIFISDFGKSYFFKQIFQCSFIIVVGFIPFLVVIASNIYLFIKLNKSKKRRKTLTNQSIEVRFIVRKNSCINAVTNEIEIVRRPQRDSLQRKLNRSKTYVLFIAVMFYFMCQCPYFISKLIEINSKDFNYYKNIYLVEISNLLLSLNLTFNFSIFYLKHH
jgi:Ca2+/Na+ antiporter